MKHIATEAEALLAPVEGDEGGPNVVAVGGGHGLAQALTAARQYAARIDAVVTVADDGGSSGRLAPALDIPPPGDIRKCLIALTPEDTAWRRLFEHRFAGSDVAGHSLGNLIIAALADIEGSFRSAIRSSERLLGAVGSVIPAADAHLGLVAVIDGTAVRGQATITKARGEISAVDVVPDGVDAEPDALLAIAEADQILLGPGSLFTSVIATLRVPGIVDAINRSGAQLVYVANLTTQDGETLGMDGADHLDALIRLTGVRPPAAIVANDAVVNAQPPLEPVAVDAEVLATYGADLIVADLVDREAAWPQHDPVKLGGTLGRLFRG